MKCRRRDTPVLSAPPAVEEDPGSRCLLSPACPRPSPSPSPRASSPSSRPACCSSCSAPPPASIASAPPRWPRALPSPPPPASSSRRSASRSASTPRSSASSAGRSGLLNLRARRRPAPARAAGARCRRRRPARRGRRLCIMLGGFAGEGLAGQFAVGLLLGLVWAPCVGPTLSRRLADGGPRRESRRRRPDHARLRDRRGPPVLLLGLLSREALLRWRGRMRSAGSGLRRLLSASSPSRSSS